MPDEIQNDAAAPAVAPEPAGAAPEPTETPEVSDADVAEGLFSVNVDEPPVPEAGDGQKPAGNGAGTDAKPQLDLSQALEHIAQRDREMLVERKQRKDLEARMSQFEEVGTDPDKLLRAFGHDPVDYVYKGLQKGDDEPKTDAQELAELKERYNADLAQRQQQAHQQHVHSLRQQFEGQLVQSVKPEGHPYLARMLRQPGSAVLVNDMVQYAAREFKQTGQRLSPDAIVAAAEQNLAATIRAQAEALRDIEDFRSTVGASHPQPTSTQPQAQTQSPTLSRNMGGEAAAAPNQPLTEEEEDQQFIDLIKNKGWVE
jgi:hypothetical protein